jgi:uncharacterized protein (DUF4415 family)
MTQSTKTDWQRLSSRNDDEINYSDIPNTDEKFWDNAEILKPHKKVDFTITIDDDLALWLKEKGNNSNQILNTIIRSYYLINS